MLAPWKESYDKARQHIKKHRHHSANKVPYSQRYGFSSSHARMWEGWAPRNWCLRIVVLENTLESPLDWKEIKSVNPAGNWPWIFIGSTDAEAEAPILWLPDAKNWLIEKDLDAGKDFSQKEKGMTEYEMVGWHHRINGREFEQTLGDSETQASLVWCSPWGGRESDTTEWLNWLNWTELIQRNSSYQ